MRGSEKKRINNKSFEVVKITADIFEKSIEFLGKVW